MEKNKRLICCELECDQDPVFHIQDIGIGKTYMDYFHACERHLHEMIGDGTCEVRRLDKEEIENN